MDDVVEVTELSLHNVVKVVGMDQSVRHGLCLWFEGAKHAIPNDQESSVVLIQVTRVSSVVHAVVGRCVEDKLQNGSHASNGPCVDPKLVEGVDLAMNHECRWGNEEGHGHVGEPGDELLENALPCCCTQILHAQSVSFASYSTPPFNYCPGLYVRSAPKSDALDGWPK